MYVHCVFIHFCSFLLQISNSPWPPPVIPPVPAPGSPPPPPPGEYTVGGV